MGVLDEFPVLSQEELDEVNDLYDHYLFYEKSGNKRMVWTSCCHREGELLEGRRTETAEWAENMQTVMFGRHNDEARCPFCGKPVTLKAKGMGKAGLGKYIPVVIFHCMDDGNTVYAQGYWTYKNFKNSLCGYPQYSVTRVYRFRHGESLCWASGYGGLYQESGDFFKEPFGGSMEGYKPYRTVGLDRLQDSFLRYTWYQNSETQTYCRQGKTKLMRFLNLAARYPENVEMLMKSGMESVVEDWTLYRKKNAYAIKWGETDPRRAFNLNGGELREFLASQKSMDTLALYKRLRKAGEKPTIAGVDELFGALGAASVQTLTKNCKAHEVKLMRVVRYLKRFWCGCGCGGGSRQDLATAASAWNDYVTEAEATGLELWKDAVLLPGDLWQAHDDATLEHNRRLEETRRLADAEAGKLERRKRAAKKREYEKRRTKLELRYGWEAEGLIIRAPNSEAEIEREGKILEHCVGGYAKRHVDGACTILFLRRAAVPNKPFLTIEMAGGQLVQIHGLKNEGIHTAKGRFAPDPRETYREFLDRWINWVKGGSRRDKDGKPILQQEKKDKKEGTAA